MPGGETNVSRRLERILVSVGVWRMTPMPSLLAEPSQPRAIYEDLFVNAIFNVLRRWQ